MNVLTADVEKMYRQINIHPDGRDLQRIVWRTNESEPIQTYTLNTVTYGTTSAPVFGHTNTQTTCNR